MRRLPTDIDQIVSGQLSDREFRDRMFLLQHGAAAMKRRDAEADKRFWSQQLVEACRAVGRHLRSGTLGSAWGRRSLANLRHAWNAYQKTALRVAESEPEGRVRKSSPAAAE
ncbi:hypothetical protein D3093_35120 (plasmid) [Azospirillum argentinense]|uniref:Uncharacterized protein n=1 Tax=Azospirillum argentinense TaxID=2970906 RepID=A0A4D8PX84_9PROT|nr:hypothetical protein [Azospirillum argentinense]QCO00479.1 hypothetical protein D3093_35120 [Azospirillum argentinense]